MRSTSYRPATWRAAVLALLVLSATACGKKDADDAGDAGRNAGPAVGTAPVNDVAVTDVRLGKALDANKRVTDETDDFDPKDMIYASVLTSGSSPNAVLHARWTFEDGQLVDSTTQTLAPTGDAATDFHIMKPDGFPKGKYKLTVLLNGSEARTKEFKVD